MADTDSPTKACLTEAQSPQRDVDTAQPVLDVDQEEGDARPVYKTPIFDVEWT